MEYKEPENNELLYARTNFVSKNLKTTPTSALTVYLYDIYIYTEITQRNESLTLTQPSQ